MSVIIFTVVRIDPPRPGGKKNKIIGMAGEVIYAYPDKAAQFVAGRHYEVNVTTSEYNGKPINNLETFKEVAAPARQEPAQSPPTSHHAAQSAAFPTPEQMFVSEVLTAYIGAGKIEDPVKLTQAIINIRKAWHHTFGDTTFVASEAGRRGLERVA